MKFLARIIPLVAFVPMLAFAASDFNTGGQFSVFLSSIVTFINGTLVPFVFAISFIVFIWGVFKTFILGGHEEEKQKEGKQLMIYAIIGFVVMLGLWGMVNFVSNGLGFGGQNAPNLPRTPNI